MHPEFVWLPVVQRRIKSRSHVCAYDWEEHLGNDWSGRLVMNEELECHTLGIDLDFLRVEFQNWCVYKDKDRPWLYAIAATDRDGNKFVGREVWDEEKVRPSV